MTARHILLRPAHMAPLRDHPAIDAMSDAELRALEALMGFRADQAQAQVAGCKLPPVQAADIQAFAELRDQSPDDLLHLAAALERLGLTRFLIPTRQAAEALRHRREFAGITKGCNRDYKRRVSVPVEDLPADWQQTLRRLRREGLSTIVRMESRLGMFAWSCRQAGYPVDLGCIEALQTFYQDMRKRSIDHQNEQNRKKGFAASIDTPRWAYLRGAWEELRRFARAHGMPQQVWDTITETYDRLTRLEEQQEALKFSKLHDAGTASDLLREAEDMLAKAKTLKAASKRHALRNRAVAIALGLAVPARPGDVEKHHVLGKGITFEPGRGAYRIRYVPEKTRGKSRRPLNIPLLPWWNKFLDALVLQDQDPSYIGELRAKAIAEQRPLYVQYDGTPAVYAWYSRMWEIVTDTGGHIARTLVYDEMASEGEFGIRYAQAAAHHVTGRISAKYRSARAVQASYDLAHDTMIAMMDEDHEDDDISDLL
ncbi:hypothetical protein [Limimaricola litoreus]|uniref:Uncharacterized protein n=1 Tax=Limimaricola litoreus TaxID=2955316 RepID=A0A9X2FWL5_9RHOB|nr:hypothetical protein [Limimaricola litoreus]MCP1168908.1 hypothetical protein [Limimaricola litoreus]